MQMVRKEFCEIDHDQYEVAYVQDWTGYRLYRVRRLLGTERGYLLRVGKENWRVIDRVSGMPDIMRFRRVCHAVGALIGA